MKRSLICKGCWEQLHMPVPIRGPLAIPFRMFGLRTSRMNPNLCTLCELMFSKVMKKKQIQRPATILFADLRGYTPLSQAAESTEMAQLLSRFYENCAEPIWERDGIINKLIGDAIMAIFNWPMSGEDHARRAVEVALEVQRCCHAADARLKLPSGEEVSLGVGIGIHTGEISMGEVGDFCRDYTAIGQVVNLASRLQGAAQAGEVLVTEEVYRQARDLCPTAPSRSCSLKGIEKPVPAYVLST